MRRIDEEGPHALLQLREPVKKFPDFVRYLVQVQRLSVLCPSMGKVKIAETLCRAVLHLGVTTVGRILKENRWPSPGEKLEPTGRVVTAQRPNHLWACRSHCNSHVRRLMDSVAALLATTVLAVLLVGGRRHRPLLQARRGLRGI